MKIAFVLPAITNKGPIIVVQSIMNYLSNKVNSIDVYYFDDPIKIKLSCNKITKIDFNVPFDFDSYDIIHSNGYRPDKYIRKWKKRITKAKTLTTIHSNISKDLSSSYNLLVSLAFTPLWLYNIRIYDLVVTVSIDLKNRYSKWFKKIYAINNGISINPQTEEIDPNHLSQILSLKTKYKVIGTYANITKNKGIHQIIDVLENIPDFSLVVIGEGIYKNQLLKLVKKKKLEHKVLFLPYLKDPFNYLELFDIYIMPSYSEGFGLALIEAAQAMRSVVCSDIPVFREIFSDEEVTFFDLDNHVSLISAINSAYLDRVEKGRKAYETSKNKYSAEIMAENYLKAYKDLL